MGQLRKQTISGIKWLVGSSFLQKGISVATTVVLARILNPSIFGLFALAFVAIDGLSLFKSMGFDSALIQREGDIEKAANTAFFILPTLGIVVYLILAISAPMIGGFLNNGEVVGVIRALGIIYVISCFGNVHRALLEKNMQFKRISSIEISTSIIYSITAIFFALLGNGVWSLVIGYIAKILFQNIMFWAFSRWRPRFQFDGKIALEMFHFGKFLFLSGLVWFLKMNLDNLLVGKLLGVTALGLYAIAFNVSNFGADYFGSKVSKVIFPAFSKIQSDKNDLRQAFLKTTKYLAIFAFPLCTILFLLGGDLIKVIYGMKWIGAIPVLKVLVFAGLFNTLPVAMWSLFKSTGHPKAEFWFSVIQVSLFFLLIAPLGKLYGLIGVGIVVALASLVANIALLPFTKRLIQLKIKDIYLCIRPSLMSSLLMGLGIILLKYALPKCNTGFIFYYNSTTEVIFAGATYCLLLLKIEKNIFKEIKEMVLR